MGNLSESQIIEGLINSDDRVINYLYKAYFPMVKFIVNQHHGTYQQSVDIFHESVIVLLMKVRNPDFHLNCAVKTYLYAIARNLWYQQIERHNRHVPFHEKEEMLASEEKGPYEDEMFLRQRIYQRQFLRLSEGCQKLIRLFLEGISFTLITREMGFKSKKYTIKRKYECIKKLHGLVKSDPEFEDQWSD